MLNMPIYLTLFFYTQAILHFVNQNMLTMGLQVTDMDKQVKKKLEKTEHYVRALDSLMTSPEIILPS